MGLYYLGSENKGTDHREADLRHCFRPRILFLMQWLISSLLKRCPHFYNDRSGLFLTEKRKYFSYIYEGLNGVKWSAIFGPTVY